MGTIARYTLAINAIGAAGFSILHVVMSFVLNRPVNIYLAVTIALCVVATLAYIAATKQPDDALFVYCLATWGAITFMSIHYASTGPYEQLPSVLKWLTLGAFLTGVIKNTYAIIYVQLSALTFLWSTLLYNDPVDAMTQYPLIVTAAVIGVFYRGAKGQLDDIDAMLRICNAEKQEQVGGGPSRR